MYFSQLFIFRRPKHQANEKKKSKDAQGVHQIIILEVIMLHSNRVSIFFKEQIKKLKSPIYNIKTGFCTQMSVFTKCDLLTFDINNNGSIVPRRLNIKYVKHFSKLYFLYKLDLLFFFKTKL